MELVFPYFLTFSFFVPFILRLGIAVVFGAEGRSLFKGSMKERALAVISSVISVALLMGFLTQVAAIAGIAYIVYSYVTKQGNVFRSDLLSIVSGVLLLSLLLSGAGALAFDLPY